MDGVSSQVVPRRFGVPVSPQARAGLTRAASQGLALAVWIVLPALCVLMLMLGTDKLSRHLDNIPAGIQGTYRVTSHSCSGEVCITGGTFISADGRLIERNLLGVYNWQDGETHQALYDSNSVDVIPLPAHWDPTATITGMVGALGFFVLWAVFLYRAIRRWIVARQPDWDVSALT